MLLQLLQIVEVVVSVSSVVLTVTTGVDELRAHVEHSDDVIPAIEELLDAM